MKKLICFGLLALLLSSCFRQNQVRISGQLQHGNGRMIHLSLLTAEGLLPVDSCVVRRNAFQFSISEKVIERLTGSADPVFFQLSFTDDNGLTTLARGGQTVLLKADADRLVSSYRVEGPEDAMLMWELDSALSRFVQYTDTLMQVYQYYMDNDSVRKGVEHRYNRAVDRHTQYLRDFIYSHPYSFSSMIAFYQEYNYCRFFNEKKDVELLRMFTDSLAMNYPNSQYVKYLQSRIRKLHRDVPENVSADENLYQQKLFH